MEKQKRWQFFIILAVIALTIYNIFPTIFYYSNSLKKPINEVRGKHIAVNISERTNDLAQDSIDWLQSFCKNLNVKPSSITIDKQNPELVHVAFNSTNDADVFRNYLPRAGSLIPFVPSQLSLYQPNSLEKDILVQRKIPLLFDKTQVNNYFTFSFIHDDQNEVTPFYRSIVNDRATQILLQLVNTSENAQNLQSILANANDPQIEDLLLLVSRNIISFSKTFGENSSISARYFTTFTQATSSEHSDSIRRFISVLEAAKDRKKLEKISLEQKNKNLGEPSFLETIDQQKLDLISSQEKTLTEAVRIVKNESSQFAGGKKPVSYDGIQGWLNETASKMDRLTKLQHISLENRNPFIKELIIDWNNEKIVFKLHDDVLSFQSKQHSSSYLKNASDQLIFDEIAHLSRESNETIRPQTDEFAIVLNSLSESKSILALNLSNIAQAEANQAKQALLQSWNPRHADLKKENFPILDYDNYVKLSAQEKKLGLVVYAPVKYNALPLKGFKSSAIYVVAKGLQKIVDKARSIPDSPEMQQFMTDFQSLKNVMQQNGFYGFPASVLGLGDNFKDDYVFENSDYFQTLIKATREDFSVRGTKKFAVLEFSNVEQRILTENKIDTLMQEDLLKWRDDYNAAQVGIRGVSNFDVPPVTKSPFLNNLKISAIKYFRGDDRKILKWGLDLSGGKTIQIELRDTNNRMITNPTDIQQGINELYKRVNKMGVSEVNIRQEGDLITLDFPGAQGFSASELVKASTMFFHVVNEKFSSNNSQLAAYVEKFLQEVWNEAVVTNQKDPNDVNRIAWSHLYGNSLDQDVVQPRSEAAEVLLNNGFKLASSEDGTKNSFFNDIYSTIAIHKGDSFTEWNGQSHPLIITFNNYALEGSNLENVRASYDPSKGNFLGFEIKASQSKGENQKINPRNDLFAWTSQFSKEKIDGTPNEKYSGGRGWRMAVILNGLVINAPTLDSPLRDSASITGSFSQREINQLEADLKAGSLSFTPRILSERNVSPEIGSTERIHAILATILSIVLVIITMIAYYRFGGIVASVAVIFNILIMWATLQNLQATMTLAGLAGIILTIGMAVDANVLVFERVREEFAVSKRIATAINAGYRKAFSAIFDSNITTIIAALILLQFDSGPIKAFAVTLIIGIVSSMFTALFMTRFFFAGWVKNPNNKNLAMGNFISSKKFNFLKFSKPAFLISTVAIIIGLGLVSIEREKFLGMDFTGGFSLTMELEQSKDNNYRQAVEKALVKAGLSEQDFQIRELSPPNHVRLFLSRNLDKAGQPFYNLPEDSATQELGFSYQSNPKIVWIVKALKNDAITLSGASLDKLDKNWSEISGQMSSSMRNAAIIGLCLALLSIMAYITIRFEFKYAISATLCIIHDVLLTVALMTILYLLGVPVQIDLHTIAALLTIIGYSLNDTIIIFDRIREDIKHMRKLSFYEIINQSLNTTLSRTLLTSGTTLLVLIPLILLGGSTIFSFSLVMAIGVVFGTLSSLFIASPLLLYFHDKEENKRNDTMLLDR